MLCVYLFVSVSVSVWEGGSSWLREVMGKHGSNFLPFSGPSFGYLISLQGSLGNGHIGPNPCREVTGGHGRLQEVTGGYGGGKRRKVEERQEKGRRKPKKSVEGRV